MIIVKVMGGLGNQLFQYAFARNIEKLTGRKVKIDISYFRSIPERDTTRLEQITDLFPHFEVASSEEVQSLRRKETSIYGRILRKLRIQRKIFLTEDDVGYQKDAINSGNAYLEGYWQAENYFREAAANIREELVFPTEQLSHQGKDYLEKIKRTPVAVSIHVRAGDYLNAENQACFGNICTAEYYQKACAYLKQRYPDCVFFLFTNDVEWTRKNIKLAYEQIEIVDDWDGKQEWVDMFLMSQCTHNVIANSSYSWWGAWLNQHENKMVICPSKWTNNNTNKDTICKGWIRTDECDLQCLSKI